MNGQYICFREKSQSFYKFSLLIPYFHDMGIGRVTLPCKSSMRGQYVFLMVKSLSFYICFVFSIISSGDSVSYFIEMMTFVVSKVP